MGAQLQNADNLAVDADGTLYVMEDFAARDIWAAKDTDGNGQAEVIGRWASLSTLEAEPSGPYFNPAIPGEAFVNIQHPRSDQDATVRLRNLSVNDPLVGDSNHDGVFTTEDLVLVFAAGKYATGQSASFEDGDWNGDQLFDERDIVDAFVSGNFRSAAAAPVNNVEAASDLVFEDDDRLPNI